jgi:peptidyl-prolyl cis-trans isomerase C
VEFSTGPSGPTGGDLGCSDPSRFVAEFAAAITDAPVGTIIGPVQTEFGFHVITVTAFEEQTVNAPDAQSLVGAELRSSISQVEVEVDPVLGMWDAARGAVIPPG